jgi:hypothetical protein
MAVESPLTDGNLVSWRDQYLNMTDETQPTDERLTEALMVATDWEYSSRSSA